MPCVACTLGPHFVLQVQPAPASKRLGSSMLCTVGRTGWFPHLSSAYTPPPQGDDEVRAVVGDVYSAAKAQAMTAATYTGDDDVIDSQVRCCAGWSCAC